MAEGSGHRQRLRQRFVAGEANALTDEALLELVLTYAIPQKDVRTLAQHMIATFGSLDSVLVADRAALCAIDGIGEHVATLLHLIGWLGAQCFGARNAGGTVSASLAQALGHAKGTNGEVVRHHPARLALGSDSVLVVDTLRQDARGASVAPSDEPDADSRAQDTPNGAPMPGSHDGIGAVQWRYGTVHCSECLQGRAGGGDESDPARLWAPWFLGCGAP